MGVHGQGKPLPDQGFDMRGTPVPSLWYVWDV
jgi:hypothetical protein